MFKAKVFLLSIFFLIALKAPVQAVSYVFPYPSFMPGSKLYRIHQVWEKIDFYRHWGNLAKFKYHLKYADKYLVEAKTLFEYGQHLLALEALQKSNQHWQQAGPALNRAADESKEIRVKRDQLASARQAHQEILKILSGELPETIVWQSEYQSGESLEIKRFLEEAIIIREKI